jgi:secretion/DNA translocation related CpaE-like protein
VVLVDPGSALRLGPQRRPRGGGTVLVVDGPVPQEAWRLAVHAKADHVLALPQQEHELVRVIGEQAERRRGEGRVIAVLGARGGAGVSTLASAIALVAARSGARSLAIDLDPFGGGLDLVLGLEREPGLRWEDLALSGGRVSATALHEALPGFSERLSVLSVGRDAVPDRGREIEAEAVLSVLDSARLAGDVVVVDVPRRWEDAQQAVVEAADTVVVVVPAELRCIAAGRDLAARVVERCANAFVVVRGPSPGGLRVSRVAAEVGLPLLSVVHHEHHLAVSVERGGLTLRRGSSMCRTAHAVLGLRQKRRMRAWAW